MDKIRLGVVGVGRGRTFMRASEAVGVELVAICDTWEERLREVGKALGVTTYADYDRMLEHDLDAVVLANYWHEHAPFAIKAFEAGLHVMSECAACHTLAQGVALARAFEQSGKVYMFAENYPYMLFNQEMRRLYRAGKVGELRYAEGEYVHPSPAEESAARSCGYNHWRNWMPRTYYCTHSLAPIMFITETRPVQVNALIVPYDYDDPALTMTVRRGDTAGVILCRMDNGAVVKLLQGSLRGHGNFVRIHGNKGLMENCRHADKNRVRVWREPWEKEAGEPVETVYLPDFPAHHQEAVRAGHGGGDFFTLYHFADAIRAREQPFLDVYRGIDMSIVGILAYRSALQNGAPLEVPDFRDESVRVGYENDRQSPDPATPEADRLPSSILGQIDLSPQARAFVKEVWARQGYFDD